MLNKNTLKEFLDYNLNTGIFTWKVDRQKHTKGKVAGTNDRGYARIKINGQSYAAHRLAWLYVYGEWPNCIDHINRDRGDNRICNLRSVSHAENMKNLSMMRSNTSGITGVAWHKRDKKWAANIGASDRLEHLGYFDSLLDACSARKSAEIKYKYCENHGIKAFGSKG